MSTGIILRPYQNKLANDLRKSFAVGKKKPLAVSPTGCVVGETIIRINRNKKGYDTASSVV